MDDLCDGCAVLRFAEPVNRYDCHSAMCCDTEKPAMGEKRVVATAMTAKPRFIKRPAWCRGKRSKA